MILTISGSRSAQTTTKRFPTPLSPSVTNRCSPTASGSSREIALSSSRTVAASENLTPWRLKFASAFTGSHSISTQPAYRRLSPSSNRHRRAGRQLGKPRAPCKKDAGTTVVTENPGASRRARTCRLSGRGGWRNQISSRFSPSVMFANPEAPRPRQANPVWRRPLGRAEILEEVSGASARDAVA